MKKKILLTLIALMGLLSTYAYDYVLIDGLYYKLDQGTATVACSRYYTDSVILSSIVIPMYITYGSRQL